MSISKIETGRLHPSEDKLEALAKALDLPVAELVEGAAREAQRSFPDKQGTLERSRRSGNPRGPAIARAVQVARANSRRVAVLNSRGEQLQAEADRRFGPLAESHELVRKDFLEPFFAEAMRVSNLDLDQVSSSLPQASEQSPAPGGALLTQQTALMREISRQLGIAGAGALGGATVGSTSAAATYAAVSAFATASTGTAIGTLSGAAASSAGLAFLGGGSLAAGGYGVTGGIAVLSTVVAAPALLATGVAVTVAERKLLSKQRDEAYRIAEAERLFDDTRKAIEAAYPHAEEARRFLKKAHQRGSAEIPWLRTAVPTRRANVEWSSLDQQTQLRIARLLSLAVVTLTVLPLPVIPQQDGAQMAQDEVDRANREVLDDAFDWLRLNRE